MRPTTAGALKCTARDRWIGWSPRDRFGRLHLVANNVHLLLRGRQPNLGSRFLGPLIVVTRNHNRFGLQSW